MTDNVKSNKKEFEQIMDKGPSGHSDESNTKLQQENQNLKDKLQEERILWIISMAIVFDSFVFSLMDNWGGPIAILILQLAVILVLAKRFGVEEISGIMEKILYSIKKK